MAEKTGTILTNYKEFQWHIFLFGGIKIFEEGKLVSPPPYRTHSLLAFLLLRDKLPIKRERLGGLLYGELPESKVRRRISDYIWLIKKHLPGFPIISNVEYIDLDKSSIWLDLEAFREDINQSEVGQTESFLELYKGELLPELYDDWVFVERERWRSYYLMALREHIGKLLAFKKFESAISNAERLLREEPYDEATVRLLMQTYIKVGRRGAALAAYEKYYLLSTEQFGLEPDARTKQIYKALKLQATTPRQILEDRFEIPSDPDAILEHAQFTLNQGNQDQFRKLLNTLPGNHLVEKQLLEVDEKLLWEEVDQAEKILLAIQTVSPSKQLRDAKLALARKDYQRARGLAESILREVKHWKNHQLEAEALIVISLVNAELGNGRDVLLTLDRVIAIAEKINAPAILVQALMHKGIFRNLQGFGEGAKDILQQATNIARKNKLQPLLAKSLAALGKNACYYGDYQSSLKYLAESLEITRDLHLPLLEANVLLAMSGAFDFLGRHAETLKAIQTAAEIYEELQDPLGMAKCYYNLSFNICNVSEERINEAIEYANKALKIFIDHKNLGWQASTYTALGFFQWLAGQADQAVEKFDAAVALHTKLEEYRFLPENYAYKGLAFNSVGDPQKALEFTDLAIQELTRRNISDIAAEIYYAHACVLSSLGQAKEAKLYIELGHQVLQDVAKEIKDETARIAYFKRDPITRRLMQLVYDFGIAPRPKKTVITHKLPGSSHYQIDLALTVDAGAADQALESAKGSKALRRARLKRILQEGNIHGSQLSIKEMAKLFNVSTRTIQRDLKFLENH